MTTVLRTLHAPRRKVDCGWVYWRTCSGGGPLDEVADARYTGSSVAPLDPDDVMLLAFARSDTFTFGLPRPASVGTI